MNRKIIQMHVEPRPHSNALYNIFCLCNDGTIWIHEIGSKNQWRQLEQIPQPETEDDTRKRIENQREQEFDEIMKRAQELSK
jgi:hypothetical protein